MTAIRALFQGPSSWIPAVAAIGGGIYLSVEHYLYQQWLARAGASPPQRSTALASGG